MLHYTHSDALADLIGSMQRSILLDKIFLLGVGYNDKTVNSIFCPGQITDMPVASYYLLALTRDGENRRDDVIADMLEQRNKYRIPINLIVYPVKCFYQWLKASQLFAVRVIGEAPKLYDAGITNAPEPNFCQCTQVLATLFEDSQGAYQRSSSFLAGAELFRLRQDYRLCAFNLHQATEFACTAFMMRLTGLRTNTHNLDKLLRYSSLVCEDLNMLFPRTSNSDKEVFALLQKAYIYSRYKEYNINEEQINVLMYRVKKLNETLAMMIVSAQCA